MKKTTPGQSPAKKRTRAEKLKHKEALQLKRSKLSDKKKLERESEKRAKRAVKAENHKQEAINQERARRNAKRREVMDIVNKAEREGGSEGVKGLFKSIFKKKQK
ncbi:MAG TPA: hypothetical protein DIT25_03905 [Candidatus Moranbacteria bacterium]|nr:hypothetical protein [Candidatus Moranbacteria bacterium]